MKTIYLATDPSCWSEQKIKEQKLGGAENFFWKLYNWLIDEGYMVRDPVFDPSFVGKADLVIHSNGFNPNIAGKQHMVWAGSWHASVNDPRADKVIVLSEFMKKELKCDRAIVIPAPYDKQIENYKGLSPIKGRISCTSNPNRWFSNASALIEMLVDKKLNCSLLYCGGNRLYGDGFGECYNFHSGNFSGVDLVYQGVLDRHNLLGLLSGTHVWIYPNFQDQSETFCVSMIEAAVLGIPVILPNRLPFTEVLPEAIFVDTLEEMAGEIEKILCFPGKVICDYDVSRYSEKVVKPQLLKEIEEML